VRKLGKTSIWYGAAAIVVAAGVALLASPAGAKTGAPAATAAAVGPATAPVYPTFVTLPADQAAHPDFDNEWWYVVGHLKAHGHEFGYEVQIIARSNIDGSNAPLSPPEALLAITDVTAGKYYTQTFRYSASQGTFSTTTLDASTPNATLSGPLNAMHLKATMPAGTIDLTLDAHGPALYNLGTGLIPFLGGSSYFYALPDDSTTGTLVENGHTYNVSGQSWIDRQYGNWDWGNLGKWTWMGIQLSNGVDVSLFDSFSSSGTEKHFATALEPDGTEHVVAVEPLAPDTSGFVTSPTTGQRYGTQWRVRIPALHTTLTVRAFPKLQEIQANGGIYEGDTTITGSYEGKPVTGHGYAEQIGNWHS
jgi:predicted secreted hydrolase